MYHKIKVLRSNPIRIAVMSFSCHLLLHERQKSILTSFVRSRSGFHTISLARKLSSYKPDYEPDVEWDASSVRKVSVKKANLLKVFSGKKQ